MGYCYIHITPSFRDKQDEYNKILKYMSHEHDMDIHAGNEILLVTICTENMLEVAKYLLLNHNYDSKKIDKIFLDHYIYQISFDLFKIFIECEINCQFLINRKMFNQNSDQYHSNIIKLLLCQGCTITNEYLMNVIELGHIETIKIILDENLPDIDINFNNGDPIRVAIFSSRYDIYKLLVSYGANFKVEIFDKDLREKDIEMLNFLTNNDITSNDAVHILLAKMCVYENMIMTTGLKWARPL
jgi:hypothetical protein